MIETERLSIRTFRDIDAAAFFELSQDKGFGLFPITDYRQKDVETAGTWIEKNKSKYAVWEKKSGQLIGMGGLTPWTWEAQILVDITYRLRESAWGQAYGTELAHALMNYALHQLHLTNITATITPDNQASKKIAEKIGLIFDKRILLLGVETDLYRLQ